MSDFLELAAKAINVDKAQIHRVTRSNEKEGADTRITLVTGTVLFAKLGATGDTVNKAAHVGNPDGTPPAPGSVKAGEAQAPADAAGDKPLEELSKKELKAIADGLGLEYPKKITNADLITLIVEASSTTTPDGAGDASPTD